MRAAILIINLIVAYILLSGWPVSFPMWLRAGLALIVVMLAVPLSDASSRSKNRTRMSSLRAPKWLDYLYIGAVIFCIELLLLAVFTLGPQTTEDFHGDVKFWIMNEDVPVQEVEGVPTELSDHGAGNWLWDNHFRRSHPKQVSQRPPNKPEIFMKVTSKRSQVSLRKHSVYLRTFALDHFDGETWSIHQPTKLVIEKPEGADIQISNVNGNWRSQLPLHKQTITQAYYRNGQNILTALQNTIRADVDTLTKVSTDTFILPRLSDQKINYSYTATSQPMLLDQITEYDKNIVVGLTDSVYMSRVSNARLQGRLTDFASGVDKELPLMERLSELKKLINSQCSYSLTIENKGEINALENFLFEEKAGYCEFYASATAMLCRELGVPSRIAFGWSGGRFYEKSDLFVFRSKDAHAWAEIYLDGYGWVVFDTTPPSENGVTESDKDEDPPELTNEEDGVDEDIDGVDPEGDMVSWKKVIIVIASLVSLIILLLLLRRFTQPVQRSSSAAYVKNEPKYLQLFEKLSALLGCPVKPSQTLMQSVQLLKDQDCGISSLDELLDRILDYHYNTVYRDSPIDRAKESQFASELKKMSKALGK